MNRCKCNDTGVVCEEHPSLPWEGKGACNCGGAGMPCPVCCSPVPQDGKHSILELFVPNKKRQNLYYENI